jgi:aspartyl-tRNA(Asn)/glutamyl-tRNA(Gln) amidotransferase subunit B
MTRDELLDKYQATIGIECHVQLKTKSKLFSGADNDARDKAPNTAVSPFCFGFPGVLPVLNAEAATLSIRAGLALKAQIAELSRFERKHYFYPDLPIGYQITQLAEPVIIGGEVVAPLPSGGEVKVRIHHAHLESDAGKLTHPTGADYSLVDLNRAGTPLIEIVSEADMHTPEEARAYSQELYLLMTYAGVTNGDLYHGNMRFDVNLSVALKDATEWGTRTETKNLNSYRSVEKAAEYEFIRQTELLEKGEKIIQETRGWNEAKQKTFSQRSKEDAHDYRYFPDADIPPLVIEKQRVEDAKATLPTMPNEFREQWAALGLDISVVNTLLSRRDHAKLVSRVLSTNPEAAKRIANWFASVTFGEDTTTEITEDHDPLLVALHDMVQANELSSTGAKEVLQVVITTKAEPRPVAQDRGLLQSNDTAEIEAIVDRVLADPGSQKAVADVKAGNLKAAGYLVGQAMKLSQGKANPAMIQNIVSQKLHGLE